MRTVFFAAAIWCFILGMTHFDEDWVYQLSSWAICGVAIYGILKLKGAWRWPLAILAVLFNPIAPIHFDPEEWKSVDVLSSVVLFLYSLHK
jgi:hypothetical protein